MNFIHTHHFIGLLHAYGYPALAAIVGLESLGLPLPGEGALIVSAIYAGSTHNLSPAMVIVAAATGAIIGQVIAYWIGVKVGHSLLRRYGHKVGLTWRHIALGRLLFRKHGFKLVVVARFIIVLRVITAMLAGAGRMPWRTFIVANIIGSVAWASFYGVAASLLGNEMKHSAGPIGMAVGAVVLLITLLGGWLAHRQQDKLVASHRRVRSPVL